MNNFIYHNPTKLVFGKGQIARLPKLIPAGKTHHADLRRRKRQA